LTEIDEEQEVFPSAGDRADWSLREGECFHQDSGADLDEVRVGGWRFHPWFGDDCDLIHEHLWPGCEPEMFWQAEEDEILFNPEKDELLFHPGEDGIPFHPDEDEIPFRAYRPSNQSESFSPRSERQVRYTSIPCRSFTVFQKNARPVSI